MFQLPEEVKKDSQRYIQNLKDFQEGTIPQGRFKGIRVPWGIYSQRGGEVFMNRIRIPGGMITPAQMKALAEVSEKYGNGILHITTRQDIQLHKVRIEDTRHVIEYLNTYDLSPRGGGGNTVRNITACACAGVCMDELFDVRSYAAGLSEYLLRQETSFQLPRKFKITFSGCAKDCGGCLINDVGLLADKKNNEKGFKVFAGGGMGAVSKTGSLLEEFIPETEVGYCVAAVKEVFNRLGDRKNKHHNRMRFLIEDIGFKAFKEHYIKVLNALKNNEYISLRTIDFPVLKENIGKNFTLKKTGADHAYAQFLAYNVTLQKQKGFVTVELRIHRGDIPAKQVRALAELEKNFPQIEFRTSHNQNLYICNVKTDEVEKIYAAINSMLHNFLYPSTLTDIVSCTGALTCNLGLCNSPGLTEVLEQMILKEFVDTKVFTLLNIKINGCPNACGQHPIGNIAFQGLVRRVDGRPVPFYKLLLGGRKEAERTRLAQEAGVIPARNVPEFLRVFLKELNGMVNDKSDIYNLLNTAGRELARKIVKLYSYVPAYPEDRSFYIDWGRTDDFSLAGIGPGECGAGVLDMIEADIAESKALLTSAEKERYPFQKIRNALELSARALLVVRGIEPKNADEAMKAFIEQFINQGISLAVYASIQQIYAETTDTLTDDERKIKFMFAKDFLKHTQELYARMDSSFNFPKQQQPGPVKEPAVETELDLKGVACPINYVKTKLFLENLETGAILKVVVDDGEPIVNVPKSLENDGHTIVNIEKINEHYRITIKKG